MASPRKTLENKLLASKIFEVFGCKSMKIDPFLKGFIDVTFWAKAI
jgi:hypothetical protein